jgi:hypothetical protein
MVEVLNKEYVVYKVWKDYSVKDYVYQFAKSETNPSDNVRYSQSFIIKDSQKDVPSFSLIKAKEIVDKFNKMSKDRGYKPSWQYKLKWW